MDPSVLPGIPVDHVEREHREHERSLDGFELQVQLLQLLVERILAVAAIGIHTGRIDKIALRSFLDIMPPKSHPNVPSVIGANDILQSAHTAHARSTGVKNCGQELISPAWACRSRLCRVLSIPRLRSEQQTSGASVEVSRFHVDVVADPGLGRPFGEQDGRRHRAPRCESYAAESEVG